MAKKKKRTSAQTKQQNQKNNGAVKQTVKKPEQTKRPEPVKQPETKKRPEEGLFRQADKGSLWLCAPLIFVIGFLPLIMRITTYNTGLSSFDWFPASSTDQVDVFLRFKEGFLIGTAVICIIILALKRYADQKLRFDKGLFLLIGFGILTLISGIASQYRWLAFGPGFERFESVFAVLSYVVICYYAYAVLETEAQFKLVGIVAGVGILILLLVGFFQGFHKDLFYTNFGKQLISPRAYWGNLDSISVVMTPWQAYGTLYNPNYFSNYLSVLFPVTVGYLFAAKKLWGKIYAAGLLFFEAAVLHLCRSSSGMISLVLTILPAAVIICLRNKKALIISLCAEGALLIAAVSIWFGSSSFRDRVSSSFVVPYATDNALIEAIETTDEEVLFRLKNGDELHFTWDRVEDTGYVLVCDKDGNTVQEYPGMVVNAAQDEAGNYLIDITLDEREWIFSRTEDGYRYYNAVGKLVKIEEPGENAGIFPNSLMNGRGLIWNKSIPLLKNHILLGSGQNTYLAEYPQEDYVENGYSRGTRNAVYDVKAHSWYLMTWIEDGFIALILLLAFVLIYIVRSAAVLARASLKDPVARLHAGILIGVIAHMIVTLANDSNICTTPVFFAVLGMGFAAMKKLEEKYPRVKRSKEAEEKQVEAGQA